MRNGAGVPVITNYSGGTSSLEMIDVCVMPHPHDSLTVEPLTAASRFRLSAERDAASRHACTAPSTLAP